ncbi:MAG: hypothetical protein Q4D46_07755 [Erysipelotrichaceae bacterium]|nr:hypothetical protein [Erysipelotrichaceae bacterium]
MADLTEFYSYFHYLVCTVAIYGNDEPHFFKGNLNLRTYYTDSEKTEINDSKTTGYAVDTLFAETNKIVRRLHKERYDENRDLCIMPFTMLGDPYQIVYNKTAHPSPYEDNSMSFLKEKDPNAKGLAIVMKKDKDGKVSWLSEVEARAIIKTLTPLLDKE